MEPRRGTAEVAAQVRDVVNPVREVRVRVRVRLRVRVRVRLRLRVRVEVLPCQQEGAVLARVRLRVRG